LTKPLIDINICLDSALQRKPFAIQAGKILSYSEKKTINGFVAAHGFDTIFYLLRKKYGARKCYEAIKAIRETIQIAPVTQSVIDDALDTRWKDFEDGIHYQAALAAGCNAVISRNAKNFKQADLPILSPQEFLDQLTSSQEE
jgi:predicted nucleic acid-binding protein